jgi:hypothetical protein
MRPFLPLMLVACTAADARPRDVHASPSQAPKGLWDHWGDGRAELSGYDLVQPRYGELRRGEAVFIYVTEDFTAGAMVKAERNEADAFPILKLNAVSDFQTGIYDYNVLTSVFVPLDGRLPRGVPSKVSFSSQEWCGHAYEHVVVRALDDATRTWHSYFDGEADGQTAVQIGDGAVFADALPVLVRDLAGPLIEPGATRSVSVWPRAQHSRFEHREPSWQSGELSREAEVRQVTVPAGTFKVRRTSLALPDRQATWDVEVEPPHRLVAWQWSDGEAGSLRGTSREPYWNQHSEGDEALRARLGLAPGPRSMPVGEPGDNGDL